MLKLSIFVLILSLCTNPVQCKRTVSIVEHNAIQTAKNVTVSDQELSETCPRGVWYEHCKKCSKKSSSLLQNRTQEKKARKPKTGFFRRIFSFKRKGPRKRSNSAPANLRNPLGFKPAAKQCVECNDGFVALSKKRLLFPLSVEEDGFLSCASEEHVVDLVQYLLRLIELDLVKGEGEPQDPQAVYRRAGQQDKKKVLVSAITLSTEKERLRVLNNLFLKRKGLSGDRMEYKTDDKVDLVKVLSQQLGLLPESVLPIPELPTAEEKVKEWQKVEASLSTQKKRALFILQKHLRWVKSPTAEVATFPVVILGVESSDQDVDLRVDINDIKSKMNWKGLATATKKAFFAEYEDPMEAVTHVKQQIAFLTWFLEEAPDMGPPLPPLPDQWPTLEKAPALPLLPTLTM